MKIVEFETYCKKCKFSSKAEEEFPCKKCVSTPTRVYSRIPVGYVEGASKRKDKKNSRKNHRL